MPFHSDGQVKSQDEYALARRRADALRPGLKPGDADPSKVREFHDWTDGCAALFNHDIRELYEFVSDGAPLTIVANGPVTRPPARQSPQF